MAVVSNGTTLIDAGAISVPTGKMTLIKTLTASSSATLSFVDGASDVVLDDTYDEYVFKFINIHPATDSVDFTFNMSIDSGSNYNVTKTTTLFQAQHKEDDSKTELAYEAGQDLAQGTGFQNLSRQVGNENDENCSGTLQIFSPSSTVFVKHFIGKMNASVADPKSENFFSAGYGNTTSAVDAVQFKMSSGNIDSGVIKLYGIGG